MKYSYRKAQSGFTLVEIAIVLVIIGLLLGGILKGQELINSARVRNMADMNAGVQAAYYGFIDRFRRVPGDWGNVPATNAIGVAIQGGGDDNGRIDNPADAPFTEPNALWEQLSKAGFIQGSYSGAATEPTTNTNQTPLNAFNNVVLLGRTADYIDRDNAPSVRLNLVLGRGVPVDIARELDVKLDDGIPDTGVLRLAVTTGAVFGDLGASSPAPEACSIADANGIQIYDIAGDPQDCNTVFLY
ncbi:MAG: prepilin-type N-terminal cleavage/methylation domain-containing protein [Gammaproteobacteria bacterium]|jgi:prepilin-type N-terminal cleavage/methylation domain-containing protein